MKPRGTPPPIHFETEQIQGTPHWSPVWCASHHWEMLERKLTKCPYGCPPGPSVRTLWTTAFEILYGGSRAGMKTETGRGWLLKGNFDETAVHPGGEHVMHGTGEEAYCGICVNISYITHPRYRALILRENEKDLADWIFRARLLYGPMGASVTEKPARVTWPSGATFVMGHIEDSSAYTDYVGQEYQRIIFEELTQIPEELLYQQVIMSCRSTFECMGRCPKGYCSCGALKPQVLNTANPGERGNLWVKKRFISVGKPNEIYTDPVTSLTRIYIPSRITDNPYYMRSPQYYNQLNSLPEPKRSAWLLGDWDALSGQYFRDFRPKGPLLGDPPEANHVIPAGSMPIQSWWHRWIGGDWGYNHSFAFYGAVVTPKGQTIIYKELTGSGTGSRELGYALGKMFFQDLVGLEKAGMEPKMTLWLSPDAFSRDDDALSIAEHMAVGIDSILGEGAAYIPELWDDTVLNTVQDFTYSDVKRAKKQRDFGIIIRKAKNDRVLGWQHMQEMMRFRQLAQPNQESFDQEYALKLLHENLDLYAEYLRSFEARKPEVLPKLLIQDNCQRAIEAIPTAGYKKDTEDVLKVDTLEDDCLDALRYTLYSEMVGKVREPKQSFVHGHLEKIREREPDIDTNGLIWAARFAEDKYKKGESELRPFNVRPESSRFHKRRPN